MLDGLRIKIIYQLKILEYRIKAWSKAKEVSKAYSTEQKNIPVKRLVKIFSTIAVYMLILIVGALMVFGVYKLIQNRSLNDLQAAVVEPVPAITHPPIPVYDTVAVKKIDSVNTVSLSSESNLTRNVDTFGNFTDSNAQWTRDNYYTILANKASKTLYLLKNDKGSWQIACSFPMAIGQQPGRKMNSGDKRTPEGTYFIIERKEKRELSSIYGPLAFVLNYPNAQDRKEGRTGQGIWIHGTDPDSMPGETRGCLELANDNLLKLSSFLRDGIGTPVIIIDKQDVKDILSIPDFAAVDQERKSLLTQRELFSDEFKVLLQDWELAWESMNIDSYTQFYDTVGFFSHGADWKNWKERKIRTFEIYSKIDVTINNVLVSDYSGNSVVLKFLQIYESDKNSLENGKQLILRKKNGSWKITRELTIPKEELLL